MSIQSGVERSDAPSSRRLGDRLRYGILAWREDPNPLWMREMRQAARVIGTPIALATVTILVTLLLGAVGGVLNGGHKSPAEVGFILYQVFFSLAYFVVALVGPALGANAIASEREGNTWEAVLLTGLRPEVVARGKFLSAYTSIGLYIVALAPVGAVPFLFGGVTPFEVALSFVILFAIALVAVSFGLALSAKMQSMRGALVLTLLTAVPLSVMLFSSFGSGGSVVANHYFFGRNGSTAPIWLPRALAAAPFGWDYVLLLCVLPVLVLALPAWFLYEVTLTNLKSVTEDRSFGLKRWYVVTEAVLVVLACAFLAATAGSDLVDYFVAATSGLWLFHLFGVFLFATEAVGPSRRVDKMLAGAGRWRRRLGPGVVPTTTFFRVVHSVALVTILVCGLVLVQRNLPATAPPGTSTVTTAAAGRTALLLWAVFLWAVVEFLRGVTTFLAVRAGGAVGARFLIFAILFLIQVGPWVVVAMAGVVGSGDRYLVLASPSVFYAGGVAVRSTLRGAAEAPAELVATLVAALAYLVAGTVFRRIGEGRCRTIIDEHRRALADADARLAAEDAAALAARTGALTASRRDLAPSTSSGRPSDATTASGEDVPEARAALVAEQTTEQSAKDSRDDR